MRNLVGATVRFGRVTIPVGVGGAVTKTNEPGFTKLHACGTPVEVKKPTAKSSKPTDGKTGGTVVKIQQKDFCPSCNVEVTETVRGYEVTKGQFVVFTEEELKAIDPPNTKEITISKFVPGNQVTGVMVAENYHLIPSGSGKSYSILYRLLSRAKLKAIGSEWLFQSKEHPCAIVAENGALMLQVLRVGEDIVERDFDVPILGTDKATKTEIEAAEMLCGMMMDDLKPEDLVSGQRKRREALIEARIAEGVLPEFVYAESSGEGDLMEALQASIAEQREKTA